MKTILLFLICLCLFSTYATAQDLHWRLLDTNGVFVGYPVSFALQDSFLFAGGGNESVYRSADKGETWKEVINGLPKRYTLDWPQISTLFAHNGMLFIGAFHGRAFRSLDHGDTWKEVGKGLPDREIRGFGAVGSVLFVATAGGAGIYRSIDQGETWTVSIKGVRESDTIMHCFATIGNTIIAGGGAMYRSTDQGISWSRVMDPISAEFYSIKTQNETFYTCSSNYGVAQSTDDGITWKWSRSGLDVEWLQQMLVTESIIIAAGFSKYYISYDNGKNWIKSINKTFQSTLIDNFIQIGATIFAGAGDNIYRTELPNGVEESPEVIDGISISPNPMTNSFILSGINDIVAVTIVNSLGIEVKGNRTFVASDKQEVDVSGLAGGVYFVQMRTASGMMTKPIVVMR